MDSQRLVDMGGYEIVVARPGSGRQVGGRNRWLALEAEHGVDVFLFLGCRVCRPDSIR